MAGTPPSLYGVVLFSHTIEQAVRRHIGNEGRESAATAAFHAMDLISRRALAAVAQAWNASHSLTAHLPVDVLTPCMAHLPLQAIIRASHVCSSWRRTIVDAAFLWKNLDMIPLRMVDVSTMPLLESFLERSGDAPVQLHVRVIPDYSFQLCLRKHVHHIEMLHIDNRSMNWCDILGALDVDCPVLHTLALRGCVPRGVTFGLWGYAPRLRTLDIACFPGHIMVFGHSPPQITVLHVQDNTRSISTAAWPWPSLLELHVHDMNPAWVDMDMVQGIKFVKLVLYFRTPLNGWVATSKLLPSLSTVVHLDVHNCDSSVVNAVEQVGVYGNLHALRISASRSGSFFFATDECPTPRRSCTLACGAPDTGWTDFFLHSSELLRSLILLELPWTCGASSLSPGMVFPVTEFPSLHTLRLVKEDNTSKRNIFNPRVMRHCGSLRAPALRCVRVERRIADDFLTSTLDPGVNPYDNYLEIEEDNKGEDDMPTLPLPRALALFIANHLLFSAALLPELVVDVGTDITTLNDDETDSDALDVLRSYVSKLILLY